jgi:hypothetical protein
LATRDYDLKDRHAANAALLRFYRNDAAGLLVSVVNFICVSIALAKRVLGSGTHSKDGRELRGKFGLIFILCSQLLYVLMVFVWQFEWMRFDHLNPVGAIANYCGLALSAAALYVALVESGSDRSLMIVSAATTAGMWLFAALASVAV